MGDERIHTILIPGLACSSRLWETLQPYAWSYGAVSIADTRRDTTLEAMAQRLLQDAPERFVVAGISMGGYIALEVMRQAPERIRGLGLISTSAAPDTPEQTASRHDQRELVQQGKFDQLIEAAFSGLVDASHVDERGLQEFWSAMAHEVGSDTFVQQLGAVIARRDSRPLLEQITCPTTVIHGSGDRVILPSNARESAKAITHARLTIIDRGGHMVAQECPESVGAAFGDLLSDVAAL